MEQQRFHESLDNLNDVQREIVLSDADSLVILAGPGSGKTRVLTYRVAYYVTEKDIDPHEIIVVTFTNKAANEMKQRLIDIIGPRKTSLLRIGTFHAVCYRLLKMHYLTIGLDPKFTIADADKSRAIIKEMLDDPKNTFDEFTKKMMPRSLATAISKAKSDCYTAESYVAEHEKDFKKRYMCSTFPVYQKLLAEQGLLDFDDLLLKTCELLEKSDRILAGVQCIMVDEYQDTNKLQYKLLKLMEQQKGKKSVTVVGDPDQSIYSFRKAEPQNFVTLTEDYPKSVSINMEQNYRCTGTIIKAAMHVISQDHKRLEKVVYTNNTEGIPVSRINFRTDTIQADSVAKEIKKIMKYSKNLLGYNDIAILMRNNATSRAFESAFRAHKIPFRMNGGERFFNRIEVVDILAYLSFAYQPADRQAFERIINVPKRGIGDVSLRNIKESNQSTGENMLHTVQSIIERGTSSKFKSAIISALRDFVQVIVTARDMIIRGESVCDILEFIVASTKYYDYLKQHEFGTWQSRKLNVEELIRTSKSNPNDDVFHFYEGEVVDEDEGIDGQGTQGTQKELEMIDVFEQPDDVEEVDLTTNTEEFKLDEVEEEHIEPPEVHESVYDKDHVAEFLEYCSLCSNYHEEDSSDKGKVSLSTIHSAKGLEWPCVFIASCVDGLIPLLMESTIIEEEGRMLYVAMTRSQFLLYILTFDETGYGRYSKPSRFLDGMPKENYIRKAPDWNNDTRQMLAKAIGRPVPPDDDSLCTTKEANKAKERMFNETSSQPVDIRFGEYGKKVDLNEMGGFSPASQTFNSASGMRFSSTQVPTEKSRSKKNDPRRKKNAPTVIDLEPIEQPVLKKPKCEEEEYC